MRTKSCWPRQWDAHSHIHSSTNSRSAGAQRWNECQFVTCELDLLSTMRCHFEPTRFDYYSQHIRTILRNTLDGIRFSYFPASNKVLVHGIVLDRVRKKDHWLPVAITSCFFFFCHTSVDESLFNRTRARKWKVNWKKWEKKSGNRCALRGICCDTKWTSGDKRQWIFPRKAVFSLRVIFFFLSFCLTKITRKFF